MSIFITGATGFVGAKLCTTLEQSEYVIKSSIKRMNSLDWAHELESVDTVVHLAARVHVMNDNAVDPLTEFCKVNVDGTLNLARQAAEAGVKRFIFVSSIGVNGNVTSTYRPFRSEDTSNPYNSYSFSKHKAELGLLELSTQIDMEIVIIRPPLVYGFAAPGNFGHLMSALQKQLPLPLGAIHNKRSFVYVGNLVSLIMRCIDQPAAANQIFLVSDGQDLSTTELLQGCAKALGIKSRLLPIPQKLVETCLILLGKRTLAQRLCGNLQVDITKTRELLGWEPPFSVSDGLKATALGMAELNRK